MPQPPPDLPTNRAFVVQFRSQPPEAPLSWAGRVEHLVSGQVVRFHSLEELLAFLARVLTEVQEPPLPRCPECKVIAVTVGGNKSPSGNRISKGE